MKRGWLYVIIGAGFEVCWVVGFKYAQDVLAWTGTIAAVVLSFVFLVRAANRMPTGTAYAVFTGLGTAGTVVLETTVFGEPFRPVKVLLIALLLAGVIGLKTVTGEAKEARAGGSGETEAALVGMPEEPVAARAGGPGEPATARTGMPEEPGTIRAGEAGDPTRIHAGGAGVPATGRSAAGRKGGDA